MRLGIITISVLLGIALNVRAEENVMVDLSVLDGLNTSYIAPMQPLFPILPKKNRVSAPVRINKPALPVKMKPQPEENLSVANEQPKEVVISPKEEIKEEVVVVDVEPVSPKVDEPAKAIEEKPSSEAKIEIKPQVKPEDALLPQPEEKFESAIQEPLKDDTVSSEPNLAPQADVQAPDVSEETVKPALLVDEKILSEPTVTVDASAMIKFAPGVDTLSPEQMSQIKAVVVSLKASNVLAVCLREMGLPWSSDRLEAPETQDMVNGQKATRKILDISRKKNQKAEAAQWCYNYAQDGIKQGEAFLPSITELKELFVHQDAINASLNALGAALLTGWYLSSIEYNLNGIWGLGMDGGYRIDDDKVYTYSVRPVIAIKL